MSVFALVRCDARDDRDGCPNQVAVSTTPDRHVQFVRDLRRAGWTRNRRGEFCPVHGAAK